MRRFTVLFLVILLCAAPALIAGTTGKITGKVTDKSSGDPLPGANIMIEGTSLGAATDADGQFHILFIPPGTYSVKVRMMGYKTTTMEQVRVKIDQTTAANFVLDLEVIQGQEVTIVAVRPKVELDLTASKQSITSEEISKSWATDVRQVISDMPGVNINGGIRGGFGLDVVYHLDGLDMRDVGSNTNFTSINLTTIQELEVLTGGWNAEYGQANGAIINIVSKSAMDRIRGIVSYKARPADQYHWGRNIYAEDGFFRTTMTTTEFWDKDATWQTEWMDTALPGYDGGNSFFKDMTPEQRAEWWTSFVNDEQRFPQMNYAERMEWETEATLHGPITSKLGFLISGRFRDGVPRYPSALRYNPDMTIQGALNYQLTKNTRIDFSGVFTEFINSGAPRTNYQSSEDTRFTTQESPYVTDPYSRWLYWMSGNKGNSDQWTIRPPETAKMLNFQAKVTHVFSENSFLNVALQRSQSEYKLDYLDVNQMSYYEDSGMPLDAPQIPPRSFWNPRWGYPGDVWRNWVNSSSSSIKVDFISQVNNKHQVKAGALFSLQSYEKIYHAGKSGSSRYAFLSDVVDPKNNPYEGALYLQDKMEFEGMVINAGLRMDFFNANKSVSAHFFDPLMLHETTDGNSGQTGLVGYDPSGSGEAYKDTPMRVAFSPRIGISHPIGENTVLHFMYGKFNQRPPWQKIISTPVVYTKQPNEGITSDLEMPDSTLYTYRTFAHKGGNPALTWEKMTQFEVGFEQNIADMFSLDLTMYYKDARDLTSRGIRQGPGQATIQGSGGTVNVEVYGDPNNATARNLGETISGFQTTVNGGWADVRGIETEFATKFRSFNVRLSYTMSFLSTGRSHYDRVYVVKEDGTQLQDNRFVGASNTDNGGNGIDDDAWHPHNSAFIRISYFTPDNFGPSLGGTFPLSNWNISTSTSWADGNPYTYYAPDYVGTRTPNNVKWKDRWNTNMNIAKTIGLLSGISVKFSMQITNLLNQKHLRLPGGGDRIIYFEEDLLPVHNTTREPTEWSWYSNRPRQIFAGLVLEF